MNENNPGQGRRSKLQGDASLDLLAIEEGTIVSLSGGATAQVVDNPRDGMWILLKFIEVPEEPALEGTEELVFWADVVGEASDN
ncbi:MAG: hypothetical protein ACI8PT_004583 [Gammaproteobacteria bacterium]